MASADNPPQKRHPLDGDVYAMWLIPKPRPEWISRIEARFPGLRIRWRSPSEVGPDGNRVTADSLGPEFWDGVTILSCFMPVRPEYMKDVRYVQLTSAGADKWLDNDKYKDPNVVFCTGNGTHAAQIAEWVIGAWLMEEHKFMQYAAVMQTGEWNRSLFNGVEDSPGKRIGLLGYGAIGRQCAKVATAMGMEVYAYTRSEKPTPESRRDDSFCVPGTGDPDGLLPAKWFHGGDKQSINDFLAQDLDLLVIAMPLTKSTTGVLAREQFEILSKNKRKTYVANVARGGHIVTDDLINALETGKIRGAALDVTDPEPLPQDHPLWRAPNVFITPHVSWATPYYWDRALQLIETNLERMYEGKPLINVMNRIENY